MRKFILTLLLIAIVLFLALALLVASSLRPVTADIAGAMVHRSPIEEISALRQAEQDSGWGLVGVIAVVGGGLGALVLILAKTTPLLKEINKLRKKQRSRPSPTHMPSLPTILPHNEEYGRVPPARRLGRAQDVPTLLPPPDYPEDYQ